MALKAGCNLLRLEVISSLMTFLELFAEQIYRFVLELRYLYLSFCTGVKILMFSEVFKYMYVLYVSIVFKMYCG